ncbi:hypothetical protein D3C80_1186530 [compost metagenome]
MENLTSTGDSKAAAYIIGTPEAPLSGFHFTNVNIEAAQGLRIRHAELETKGLNLSVKEGPKIKKDAGAIVQE